MNSTHIANTDFADYVRSIKKNGSYLLSEEVLQQLTVNQDQVSGSVSAINAAWNAYSFILQSR